METQISSLLRWPYYYQGKNIEELKHSLVCTTLELETTKLAAQEEIRKREEKLTKLQELLNKAITERDEAQESCKILLLEKQQIVAPQLHSGSSSSIEDELTTATKRVEFNNNNGGNFTFSDSEESIISSPPSPSPPPPSSAVPENALRLLSIRKPLPEKGNLLQAVIKAGPLLQTLLLAGPLPQWRHPPPPLESFDIPPVTIPAAAESVTVNQEELIMNGSNNVCGTANRKRGFSYGVCDGSSFTEANKYQRVLLH